MHQLICTLQVTSGTVAMSGSRVCWPNAWLAAGQCFCVSCDLHQAVQRHKLAPPSIVRTASRRLSSARLGYLDRQLGCLCRAVLAVVCVFHTCGSTNGMFRRMTHERASGMVKYGENEMTGVHSEQNSLPSPGQEMSCLLRAASMKA